MKRDVFNKSKKLVTASVITAALFSGTIFAAADQASAPAAPSNAVISSVSYEAQAVKSMQEMLKGFDFLTKAEKNQLIASEKAKAPYYAKLKELYKASDKIVYKYVALDSQEPLAPHIVKELEPINAQIEAQYAVIDKIDAKDAAIWAKIDKHFLKMWKLED